LGEIATHKKTKILKKGKAMNSSCKFGELTYLEIKEKATKGWLAIVPTGCTEQQGPHLPVDFDTWFIETLSEAASNYASEKYGIHSLVLPAMPFGPTPEHRNYGSGYIDIPQKLHEQLMYNVIVSLIEQGFKTIIIWQGCGGHDLNKVVAQVNEERTSRVKACLPILPYHDIWCRVGDPNVPGGHADSFATSIALYLKPEIVRQDRIPEPKNKKVNWEDPKLDFHKYSSTGVIGDAQHANRGLGERLWEEVVKEAALTIKRTVEIKR